MLIKVSNLSKRYGAVRAVQQINLEIKEGETVGIIGESGCGKSTLGRLILQLEHPSEGIVEFDGKPVTGFTRTQLKSLRREMQGIFQDPYASLNPKMRIADVVGEGLDIHGIPRGNRIEELLKQVDLSADFACRYPRELSGGQRQRVAIARALALNPRFLVCDEPLASLDMSTQQHIMELFQRLKRDYRLTYLFITHDLPSLRKFADRIVVMYLGQIVEVASTDTFFAQPKHPYSEALLSAIPIPDPKRERTRKRIILDGDPASPFNPPSGCPFHPRCPLRQPKCETSPPELKETSFNNSVACHFSS